MADIVYNLSGGTYINITNKCPCSCVFCIRNNGDGLGSSSNLWFDKQPSFDDVKNAIDNYDFTDVNEVVFCGYGEPTNELDLLLNTSEYLKEKFPSIKVRLNTNGLSDLINNRPTAKEICNVIDSISVSLNDVDSKSYDEITRNRFPGKAYDALLKFTKDCVDCGISVKMSVVDVIGKEKIEKARKICESIGATFRCREYEE